MANSGRCSSLCHGEANALRGLAGSAGGNNWRNLFRSTSMRTGKGLPLSASFNASWIDKYFEAIGTKTSCASPLQFLNLTL